MLLDAGIFAFLLEIVNFALWHNWILWKQFDISKPSFEAL